MAELALGIVGVVPVVLGAITAYKHVTVKVKLFRHSFKEVKRMYKILRTQRQVFSNECLLWLEFVINDSDVASAMASDPGHEGWNDPRLDSTFQSRLKDNYEPWLEVTKEIAEAVHSIENRLEALGKSTELCEVDGKFKRTLKRTRNSLNVALDLGDLEKTIDGLRCSNNELRGLREQVTEIHKPKSTPSPRAKAFEKGEWAGLIKIRRASKALYEALEQTWNCCQPEHLGHSVKLFVETHKLLGEVQMQLAIICRKKILDLVQPAFFQLEVRSQNLEWIEQPYFQRSNDGPSAPHKRLRLAGISDAVLQPNLHDREITSTGDTEQSDKCGSYDLGSSMDICKELTQKLGVTCLGHLDVRSDEAFRHSFYEARETIFSRPLQLSSADHEAVGMDEILEESSENSLATIDRLKLARSLVSAVLKLHSTPWLSEFWGLQDLSFFKGHEVNISEILRTLHVGVEVAQNRLDSMESLRTFSGSSSLPQVSEDDKLFCGIGNLTLHSLGVALLQIDRWTKVEPCDVLKVRKMALRTSSLGPRYQEITHKCLRCDFGYGSDLTKPRLQEAVYDNVVGALEKMISSLELTED